MIIYYNYGVIMDVSVEDIINVGKNLYDQGLVSGKAGNISIRVKNEDMDVIAITPTFSSLNDLKPEDIVLVDLKGDVLTKGNPSSELEMHLNIYEMRDDVNAIVHIHPPYATGFAFSPKKIKRLEGFGKIAAPFLEEIDYESPGSSKLAKKVAEGLGNEDVLILKHHGIICVGDDIKEVESLARFVEDIAKTQFVSHMLSLTEDM